MSGISSSETVARTYIEEYNRGPDCVELFHTEDSVWLEHSSPGNAQGRERGRDDLKQAAEETLALLPNRRSVIRNLVASANHVALELDWSGTAIEDQPMIKRGETVAARIAMFLTIRAGKIIREVDYVIPNPGDTNAPAPSG